ncbi:Archaeal Lon protease [uncultured archaeon]|nr:Archaeal Lon protease [uncultured archaeon]
MFVIIAMSQLSLAQCVNSNRTLYVPAVINENMSEMVQIGVETRPGNGEAFTSIYPAVGYDTQGSERTAAAIAFATVGRNDCDVIMRFMTSSGVNHVDGPSAGGAMTVLLLSALTGEGLRDDFSITGTIESDGTIGQVGGIPLKAEAVAKSGVPLFITPELLSSDKIGLLLVKKEYNLTVAQVRDIDEAFALTTSPAMPEENLVLSPEGEKTYENASLTHWYSSRFSAMTEGMVQRARSNLDGSDLGFRANFESRLINSESALSAGQMYTAANTAFTLAIDEEFADFTQENVAKSYGETEHCLNGFVVKNVTLQNFEVIGPAQARYAWAETRLPASVPEGNGFVSSMFQAYYDTLNAKQWCMAANDLNEYTYPDEETAFDESVLHDYADEVLTNLTEMSPDVGVNSDIDFHLESAETSFQSGMYVASLVDAAYVKSYLDTENLTANESEALLQEKLSANYSRIWPQAMANHARTIAEGDRSSALRIALLASDMDDYFNRVAAIASENTTRTLVVGGEANESAAQAAPRPGEEQASVMLIMGIGALTLIAIWMHSRLGTKKRRWRK